MWIHIKGLGIDIDKNRGRAENRYDFSGRYECEWGGKDGIAGAYAVSHQRHEQGIGARRTGNRIFHAGERRQLVFNLRNFRSHDVDACDDAHQFFRVHRHSAGRIHPIVP